jgi:hypothetical protein
MEEKSDTLNNIPNYFPSTLSFEGHHYFLARACSIAGNSQGKGLGKFY